MDICKDNIKNILKQVKLDLDNIMNKVIYMEQNIITIIQDNYKKKHIILMEINLVILFFTLNQVKLQELLTIKTMKL